MAPKQPKSKKAIKEQSKHMLEDATFGLKNKNKSAKVQKYVKQVEVAVKHSDGSAARQANNELKKAGKALRAAEEAELAKLLGEGLTGGLVGKEKSKMEEKASALGLTGGSVSKEIEDLLAEFSSSSDEEDEVKEKRQTIYLDSDDSAAEGGVVVHKEKTIEDLVDDQRAKLAALGIQGTPVTEQSFTVWRKAKLEQREREAEARVKLEQSKKKGGKGLSVLSGRELFKYDAALFQDDAEALNHEQEMELSSAQKLSALAEEEMEKMAYEKAQKEQEKLMLAQQLEIEARKLIDTERKDEALRNKAKGGADVMLVVGGITINKVIFTETEFEDLVPFEQDAATDSEDDSDMEDEEDEEEEGPEASSKMEEEE